MTRTFLRALVILVAVAGVAFLLAPHLGSPAKGAPKAAPGGSPQPPPPGSPPQADPPPAPPAPAPAPAPWSEEKLASWLGESRLAMFLLWGSKILLMLLGVLFLVQELLLADRRRHGQTPAGWGPWRVRKDYLQAFQEGSRAPQSAATRPTLWPTTVAEPLGALGLGVLFPFAVQVLLTLAFPLGSRPVGDLEFGIAAVTLALLPPAVLTALRRLRLGAGALPGAGAALGLGLKFACIATLIVVPIQIAWGLLLYQRGEPTEVQNLVQIFADPATPAQPWLIAVFGIFVAPFTEEAVFRGLLYPALRGRAPGGPLGAAVIVALLFALIHGNLMAFVPLFALALVLAWVMERTNSLLACVCVHALHNAASLAPMIARMLHDGSGGSAS